MRRALQLKTINQQSLKGEHKQLNILKALEAMDCEQKQLKGLTTSEKTGAGGHMSSVSYTLSADVGCMPTSQAISKIPENSEAKTDAQFRVW